MEFLLMIFLWWLVYQIWPDKKEGIKGDEDNYIVLSDLEQDQGEHDSESGSIYSDDGGDADW